MLDDLKATHGRVPATLGGDKGYDDGAFFGTLEGRKIEPHVPLVMDPEEWKAIDILVNNAAVLRDRTIAKMAIDRP